jgi:Tfp pilus assembly protein FimT
MTCRAFPFEKSTPAKILKAGIDVQLARGGALLEAVTHESSRSRDPNVLPHQGQWPQRMLVVKDRNANDSECCK